MDFDCLKVNKTALISYLAPDCETKRDNLIYYMQVKSCNSNIKCEHSKPRKICDAINKYHEIETTN